MGGVLEMLILSQIVHKETQTRQIDDHNYYVLRSSMIMIVNQQTVLMDSFPSNLISLVI